MSKLTSIEVLDSLRPHVESVYGTPLSKQVSRLLAAATYREALGECCCANCLVTVARNNMDVSARAGHKTLYAMDFLSPGGEIYEAERLKEQREREQRVTPAATPVDRYVPLASDLAALEARVEAMRAAHRESEEWCRGQFRDSRRLMFAVVLIVEAIASAARSFL